MKKSLLWIAIAMSALTASWKDGEIVKNHKELQLI